jgi:hypothetical protein
MKDTPVFAAGSPYTFANVGNQVNTIAEDRQLHLLPPSSIYGGRWYFDSAASSMVC